MATTTTTPKPNDTDLSVDNPKKTLDPVAPPTANPDLPQDSNADGSTAPLEGSVTNGSTKEAEDSETTPTVVEAVAGNSTAAAADPVSDIQKKIRRAERFGISVQLTQEEKRNSRAERFGTASVVGGSEVSKKSEELKRKARAERFGLPASATPVASDQDAKKKARLARFAPVSKTDPLEEDKRKARAIRFSNTQSSTLSEVNGKGKLNAAAIAGDTGGGP